MYNRYIPQPDGSYRRNRMQDAQRPPVPPTQQMPSPSTSSRPAAPRDDHCPPPAGNSSSPQIRKQPSTPMGIGNFLRQLLPGDFNTEDLLVILLLLLMSGDCEEDRNNALLTLALYLFL